MTKKHKWTDAERHAVYTVHYEKCYMCGQKLHMLNVHIDHVVPESITDNPGEFDNAKKALGLPNSFDVNSYENWLPSCEVCNRQKGAKVWEPSPLIQTILQTLRERAPKAREVEAKLNSDRNIGKLISKLKIAVENGNFTAESFEALKKIVEFQYSNRLPELADDSIRLTSNIIVKRHRFNTFKNVVKVHGTGDPIDLGRDFAIHEVSSDSMIQVKFEPIARSFRKFFNIDIYIGPPELGDHLKAKMNDNTRLLTLSAGTTAVGEVGGLRVELRPYYQGVENLWVVLFA